MPGESSRRPYSVDTTLSPTDEARLRSAVASEDRSRAQITRIALREYFDRMGIPADLQMGPEPERETGARQRVA